MASTRPEQAAAAKYAQLAVGEGDRGRSRSARRWLDPRRLVLDSRFGAHSMCFIHMGILEIINPVRGRKWNQSAAITVKKSFGKVDTATPHWLLSLAASGYLLAAVPTLAAATLMMHFGYEFSYFGCLWC
ncbi:hypothetical protein CRG98_042244 [Punica granatum]|uniref:Uncharacterized protein n=1 Tax=Punica granatum TaxID=22663 RepID=A0A2I0I077_PUNGR|nr:hypothetical protein CRG98_042244 [Punica granatum]